MSYIKENNGITMVALVITIIVLLILAGASLAMIMGDSGILNKANEAKAKTNISQAEESIKLKISSIQSEAEGIATFEEIINQLENDNEITINKVTGATYISYDEKYTFKIDENYNLTEPMEYSENRLYKANENKVFDSLNE